MSEAPPILKSGAHRRVEFLRFAMPVMMAPLLSSPGQAIAAGTAHTNMSVGATVVSTCTISTQPQSGSTGAVAHSCSNFGQGGVSIAREPAGSGLPAFPERPAVPATAGDSAPHADVRYITITY